MKRLWIALILLAAILAGTLLHARALRSFTGEVTGLLDLAQAAAGAGRWTDAAALTGRAEKLWSERETALHILLRHGDTDAIAINFRETRALLEGEDYGTFAAATAQLTAQLELLSQAEELTVENLF